MDQSPTLSEHWSAVYWLLAPYDAAFDYSVALRVGEDSVLVDGEWFYKAPF